MVRANDGLPRPWDPPRANLRRQATPPSIRGVTYCDGREGLISLVTRRLWGASSPGKRAKVAYKRMFSEEMLHVSGPWADPKSEAHKALLAHPETASLLPRMKA